MSSATFGHTQRGFARLDFRDEYDQPCLLQKSSMATDDCVWLGVDTPPGHRMQLTREQVAVLLPYLAAFVETGEITPPTAGGKR